MEALFRTSEELDAIQYVSLDWLRKMKQASGWPRDWDDLENLAD